MIRIKYLKSIVYFITIVYLIIKINQFAFSVIIKNRNLNYINQNSFKFENNSNFLVLKQSDPLHEYTKIHERILESKESNKKIVFHRRKNSGGYGNSLYTFFSSLLIAILTDSALISDWEYIDYFIVPPLKQIFNKFDSNSELFVGFKSNYMIEPTSNAWKYDKQLDVYLNNHLPHGQTRLEFESLTAYLFDLCANPENFKKILGYKLASSGTIDKAMMSLKNKEPEHKIVEDLLTVGFEVASNLMNKFWSPQDFLMKEINRFYDKEFRGRFVIGMQLRFLYMYENDMDKFFKCAFYIEKINGVENGRWFLTGDDNKKIEKVLKKYPEKFILAEGQIAHTSFSSMGSYERTIFDNELLSRSNEILFTGGSTFGLAAAFRQNRMPYCVEGRSKAVLNEDEPCKRMTLNRGPKRTYGFVVI